MLYVERRACLNAWKARPYGLDPNQVGTLMEWPETLEDYGFTVVQEHYAPATQTLVLRATDPQGVIWVGSTRQGWRVCHEA